jgi:peptidyl-dipeptidase A
MRIRSRFAGRALLPVALLAFFAGSACTPNAQTAPDAAQARQFVEEANASLYDLSVRAGRADWVKANFITQDTEAIAAEANEKFLTAKVAFAKQATRFDGLELDEPTRRQLDLLKRAITMPSPGDPALTRELTQIATRMDSNYGKAQYCPDGAEGEECLDIGEIRAIHQESRDPDALLDVWVGWRSTSPVIRDDFRRFVELTNQGARELGYADTGELWRSNYDLSPQAFAAEVDRLWAQVLPLYEALHCYVRARLSAFYGEDAVPLDAPIPAHLLGNMWAQQWGNIFDLVAPADADPGYDLTALLQEEGYDALRMVSSGEGFFSSLGFAPLPDTFWERSLFTKPRDREVVCHASAWDVDRPRGGLPRQRLGRGRGR